MGIGHKIQDPHATSTDPKRLDRKMAQARMLESHMERGMELSWNVDGGREGTRWERGLVKEWEDSGLWRRRGAKSSLDLGGVGRVTKEEERKEELSHSGSSNTQEGRASCPK